MKKTITQSTTFNERPNAIFKWLLFLVFIFGAQNSFAQQNYFDGSTSNLWSVPANWSLNHVPTSVEEAIIPNGFAVQLDTNATVAILTVGVGSTASLQIGNSNTNRILTAGDVIINSGATINTTGNGGNTFNIGGNIANNGGTLTDNGGDMDIIFNGGTQAINGSGSYTFANFLFSTAGTKTINSTITVTGSWTSNTGVTVGGSGTVLLSGGSQTIGGTATSISFPNLSLSGGTKTANSKPLVISGNLSIASGALVNLGTLATHTANTLTLGGLGTTNAKFGSNSTTATAPVYKNNTYFSSGTAGYITVATSSCTEPTITFSSIPDICAGSLSYLIPYTAVTGSPNLYSISGTGITSVTNGTLNAPSSSITVGLSSAAVGGTTISPSAFTVSSSVTGCVSANLSGSVTVITAPNAGANGAVTICAGSTVTLAQLNAAITGEDAGGTWTPALAGAGTYTYTVNALPCTADTSTVIVTAQAQPNAGTDGAVTICVGSTVTLAQLNAAITGENAGGSWTPTLAGAGTYTYTVDAISPCTGNDTSTVVVTEQALPNAGTDGTVTICAGSTVTLAQLNAAITGEDAGGSWSPTLAGAGTYTYTRNATSPCTGNDTSFVIVTEQAQPNAGVDGAVIICEGSTVTLAQLNTAITGEDLGGAWTPALAGAGTYTYTVNPTSPCAVADTSIVIVTVNPEINFNNIDDNCDGSLFDGHAPVVVDITTPSGALATMDSTINSSTATNTTPYSGAQVTYIFKVTKTNAPTSVTYVTSNTPSFTFSSTSNAAHSSTYDVQATAVVNGEEQPYNGNTMTYTTPAPPTLPNPPTQTGPGGPTCAYTLSRINSYIYANNSSTYGASRYEFLVERMNGASVEQTLSVVTTVPYFKLTDIDGTPASMQVTYGATYRIKVRYGYGATSFGSQIYTAYGSECSVSTPGLPVSSIACGTHLALLNSYVYASGHAGGANQFEYLVTRVSPPQPGELPIGPITSETLIRNVPNFKLTMLTSLFVGLQKEYSVSVRYRVTSYGMDHYSAWSAACPLFTPDFPETQVVDGQCGVEGVPSSVNEYIYADGVGGATHYRFRLYNDEDAPYTAESPYDFSVYSPNKYVKLNQFPGLIAGVVYKVTVVAEMYGEYPNILLAKDCSVTAPQSTPEEDPAKAVVASVFQASAYPNPFANNFMIDVKTESQSVVSLKVYDMIGRLIEQREARVSDLETTTIGDHYPSGVYNLVVSQEDSVQTVRVVKR